MNLIAPSKRDFWRGRRVLAAMAWHLSRVLPPLKRHFERVFRRRLAAFHANVLEIVGDASRPNVTWRSVVSSETPVGDFFLREDDAAFEVRLVNDICEGKTPVELWKGRLTGIFPFAPRNQSETGYSIKPVAGGQRLVYQGGRPFRWIMLVSKRRLPAVYALEFDYTPRSTFREQLQFDFFMQSLHQRLRFMLRHNERFVFSVIDGGFFAPDSRSVPFSFKLDVAVRVRFEIVRDVFTLIVDGNVVMCVKVEGLCENVGGECALIFYDQDPDVLIDCEIANLVYEEADDDK